MKLRDFAPTERNLFISGLFLFLLGLIAFLFFSDQVSGWLGYSNESARTEIGSIQIKRNYGLRKFSGNGTFVPIAESQSVFTNDTLMTGADSGLVVNLIDGSQIELEPDSLVEIRLSDASKPLTAGEFTLDVVKGNVVGTSKVIQVQKNGVRKPMEAFKPNSMAVKRPPRVPPPTRILPKATPFPTPVPTPVPTPTPPPSPTPTPKPTPTPVKKVQPREPKVFYQKPHVRGDTVVFTWTRVKKHEEYKFELYYAADPVGSRVEMTTEKNFVELILGTKGKYIWKVDPKSFGKPTKDSQIFVK